MTSWPGSSRAEGGQGHIRSVHADRHRARSGRSSQYGHGWSADAGGNLGLPSEAYGDAFKVTFAKKARLIPNNMEILEAGPGGEIAEDGGEEIATVNIIFYNFILQYL